MSLWSRK